MANSQHWPVQSAQTEVKLLFARMLGNAALAPTFLEGAISAVVRNGVGDLTVTLDNKYVDLLQVRGSVYGTATKKLVHLHDTIFTEFGAGKTSKLRILITDLAGAASDLTAAELIMLDIAVRNSTVKPL
jgi:hypothetical protein